MTNIDIAPNTKEKMDIAEESPAEETLRVFGKRLVSLMNHPEVNAAGEFYDPEKEASMEVIKDDTA